MNADSAGYFGGPRSSQGAEKRKRPGRDEIKLEHGNVTKKPRVRNPQANRIPTQSRASSSCSCMSGPHVTCVRAEGWKNDDSLTSSQQAHWQLCPKRRPPHAAAWTDLTPKQSHRQDSQSNRHIWQMYLHALTPKKTPRIRPATLPTCTGTRKTEFGLVALAGVFNTDIPC